MHRSASLSRVDWEKFPYEVRLDSLRSRLPDWQEISFAGKATIFSAGKETASMRVYMVRDSLIHVSLRMYGMEGGIIRATRDSVMLYNKHDNYYSATSFADLMGHSGVTFSDFQDLILGAYFPNNDLVDNYCLDGKTNFPVSLRFATSSKPSVTYGRWEDVGPGFIPTRVQGTLTSLRGHRFKIELRLTGRTVKFDKVKIPSFRVARNAQCVDFSSLINYFYAENE